MAQAEQITPSTGRDMIASPAPSSVGQHSRPLSEPEKAAVIIALLGAESAGPIVEKIDDTHLRSFMTALENINQIPRESMLSVVAEFITELRGRKGGFKGGPEAAKELVSSMFPEDRVTRLFGAPPPPPAPKTTADAIWTQLGAREAVDTAKYLARQKPTVSAIILAQLNTDKTGEILGEMPEEQAVACVAEMSRTATVDPRAIDGISELVQTEFLAADDTDSSADSAGFVGEVLGILPRDRRNKMLAALEKSDPAQAERVKASMLTFEDLKVKLPVTAIPTIFRDFDQRELLHMLKAGAEQQPDIIAFFYENISQRMANDYKDQVEELGDITPRQGDAAIASLMGFLSRLEKDGRIEFIKQDPDAG